MDDLVQWLRAALDEETGEARAAAEELGPDWYYDDGYVLARREDDMVATGSQDFLEAEPGRFIARHDPARVLREIAAKRQLLDQYDRAMENRRVHSDDLASAGALLALHGAVKLLALPYEDRPGYTKALAAFE